MYPLPPYARRVEYLESTGSQWIDTELGYFPEFEIGAVVPGAVGNNTLGINQSWKLGRHSAAEPVWRATINNKSYVTSVSCGTYADMSYHGTTFKCNSDTFTVNANQYVSGTMVLFSVGVALPSAYPLKLYYCRLFDQNGNLVRSFIPCRINGIGYLWDEVNGRFHENKGTGEFVLGQDIREGAIPSKINPMGVARRLDPAPYDAELEYLEATGTQWLETGLKISTQGTLNFSFALYGDRPSSGIDCLFCARNWSGSTMQNSITLFWYSENYSAAANRNKFGLDIRPTGQGARQFISFSPGTTRHEIQISKKAFIVDGTNLYTATVSDFTTQATLKLLMASQADGIASYQAVGRLYGFEYLDADGNLVMKLVPVKKNGVGYMFDQVSGQFFGNAGTGAFGLGPVKGYIQDGLIMQLDGFYNEDTQRHNGSATVWKDLAGDRNVTLTRASNGWNKDSLNTKVVTGGSTATIAAGTFPGIHYSPGTTVEMVYRVDTAQNTNGEVLTFVGGYERMAISHVSGGTAGELFIASAPDTRIGVDMTSPDIDPDLTTREIVQQIAVVFGQSNDVTGWAIYHKSNPQPIYNRGGSLGTQSDGTGTIMGRVSSSPDNAAGVVYALRIYNRALTQEEVKHNWELDKARFNIV